MKKLIYWLIIPILPFLIISCLEQSEDDTPISRPVIWTITSPMGITIMADQLTIDQYNAYWGSYYWDGIDWPALDEEFLNWKQYLCYDMNWNCKEIDPSYLTVYIQPWSDQCVDEESPLCPKEILHPSMGCIDGWYQNQMAYFHLGDDPGQDFRFMGTGYKAFELSAYSDELLHFFQQMSGLPFSHEIYQHSTQYTIILPCECGETEFEWIDETHLVCKQCGKIREL